MPRGPRQSLIVSGWASREPTSQNGRRQLLSILLPGDLIGHPNARRALNEVEIVALSGVRTIGTCGFMKIVDCPIRYAGIPDPDTVQVIGWPEAEWRIVPVCRKGAPPHDDLIALPDSRARWRRTGGLICLPTCRRWVECAGHSCGISI